MNQHTTLFTATAPGGYRTAIRMTAQRMTGIPPRHACNLWAHIWMSLDIEPGAVYPDWTIAEDDVHQLAQGFRIMTPKLSLGDVSKEPFGIVVSELSYSNVDWVEGLVSVAMAHWLADESGIENPAYSWHRDEETEKNTLHLDC